MQIGVQANGLARSIPAKQSQALQQTSLQLVQHKQRVHQCLHLQQQRLHPSASQQHAASSELPPLPSQPMNRPSLQPFSQRRSLLLGGIATGACLIPVSSSQAAVTVTLRPKPQLKPYTLKAGYSVTVPDSWGLAYVSAVAATPAAFCGCHTTFLRHNRTAWH